MRNELCSTRRSCSRSESHRISGGHGAGESAGRWSEWKDFAGGVKVRSRFQGGGFSNFLSLLANRDVPPCVAARPDFVEGVR